MDVALRPCSEPLFLSISSKDLPRAVSTPIDFRDIASVGQIGIATASIHSRCASTMRSRRVPHGRRLLSHATTSCQPTQEPCPHAPWGRNDREAQLRRLDHPGPHRERAPTTRARPRVVRLIDRSGNVSRCEVVVLFVAWGLAVASLVTHDGLWGLQVM